MRKITGSLPPANFSTAASALACGGALLLVFSFHQTLHAEKLEADDIFDSRRLVEVDIQLPPKDWQQLRRQSRSIASAFADSSAKPFSYFQGDVTINGLAISSVGIRKKGFIGSLDEQRPSLKINFDEFVDQDPARGFGQLTLNNNKQDTSLVSQFLAYRLFDAAGVAAPRCSYARVTVNGEYLGIYTNVESIKKPFLKRQFGDSSGNLYEGTLADFYPQGIDRLEAKTNAKNNDRTQAMKLAEMLREEGDLPLDELNQLVEVDNFLKFWVMECLIGFWDGYAANQNNFFAYIKPSDGKFYFIPWGADAAFTERGPFDRFGGGPLSIKVQGSLANRLYHTKDVAARFRSIMLSLLETVWKEDELLGEIARIEALLEDHLHERQADAPESMDKVRAFLRTRRERLTKELDRWPVAAQANPRKPFYAVDVGSVQGAFDAVWNDQPVSNPQEVGTAKIELQLGDEMVAFKQLGVTSQPDTRASRGRPGGEGQEDETPDMTTRSATIVFTGTRKEEDDKVTLTLTVPREAFLAKHPSRTPVRGTLAIGRSSGGFGGFGGMGGRQARGEIQLASAGLKTGEHVSGSLELSIFELRGGIFGGGGGRMKRPPDEEADKRKMRQKKALGLFRKHDLNADGVLDKEEQKRLKESISDADTDGSGGVSLKELAAWFERQE